MKKISHLTRSIPSWITYSVSAISFLAYLIQSVSYAVRLPIILDEAAYLFKGFLFASEQYSAFQAYGPWTNKMPLAFLIPGWIQTIFSPGINTGRIFAVLIGMLILSGVWLVIRRFSNECWAAISVLMIALTPAVIKTYSQMWSQGLVAMILIWSLYFLIGENRKLWQIILGACLGVLTTLIRQNMVFYPLLMAVYVFWQHGKKTGWITFLTMAVLTSIYHAVYAPEIFRLWLAWCPDFLQSYFIDSGLLFLEPSVWQPVTTLAHRFDALWMGLRNHFTLLLTLFFTIVLTNFKHLKETRNDRFKAALFLIISLLVLIMSHSYASLGLNYCVYCFTNYLDFFIILALPLAALTIEFWEINPHWFAKFILFLSSASSLFFLFNSQHAEQAVALYKLFENEVPRVKNMKIQPGSVPFATILTNKLNIPDFWAYLEFMDQLTWFFLILSIIAGLILTWWLVRKIAKFHASLASYSVFAAILLGILFSPTSLLSQGTPVQDCGNTIQTMEKVGTQISAEISQDDFVTIYGDAAILPLLYVENDFEFPPQKLNGIYSQRLSTQTDLLPLYGFYNEEMDQAWFEKADIIIVQEKYLNENPLFLETLSKDGIDELTPTTPLCSSDKETILHIYSRP